MIDANDPPAHTVPAIRMLGDQILVVPLEADVKIGKLEVPGQYAHWMRRARIVAVGEGLLSPATMLRVPLSVRVGDVVLHRKLSKDAEEMCRILLGRDQYLVLKAGDLVAVVPA